MTLQDIIANAYRGCPPLALHDEIRRSMESTTKARLPKSMRDWVNGDKGRSSISEAAARSAKKRIAASRAPYRADVWRLRDDGQNYSAIARAIGRSDTFVKSIISEPRP